MGNSIVSIITPSWNCGQFVEETIQSILAQTYQDWELLFQDDCSTDNTKELVAKYAARDRRIKYECNEQNSGAAITRNNALRRATGKWIAFLDSDDCITPDCLEVLVAQLSHKTYDMIIGNYKNSIDVGESMLRHKDGEIEGNDEILRTYAQGEWYVMAWNKLCNRRFLLDNNLFFEEGLLHEDVVWTFKVACKAKTLCIVNRPTYVYNIRQSSIMTSMSIEKDVSIYCKAFDCIVNFVKKDNRIFGRNEYSIIEGKKSGILYSLLERGEDDVYNKYYSYFYTQCYISPLKALLKGVITGPYFVRDMHYMLPMKLGRWYKRWFYMLCYRFRNKKIEGAVWG